MDKINTIINLCSKGVKYFPLANIATIERGTRITKKDLDDNGQFIVMSGGTMPMGRFNQKNRNANTITISSYGAAGYVGFIEEDFWANDVCLTVMPKKCVLNKYLYYALKSKQKYIYANTTKAIPDHIPTKFLLDLEIPLPDLNIQELIVDILDENNEAYLKLTEAINAEISDRKKQFVFYKNELFNLRSVEYKTINELCYLVTKQTGFDYSNTIKQALTNERIAGAIPYLQTRNFSGIVFDYNTEYYVPAEIYKKFPKITLNEKCLLFSIVGASIGNVGLFPGDEKCFLGGAICVAKFKNTSVIDYVYHYMTSKDGQDQIRKKIKGSGQATVTIEDIRNFKIPFPSADTQEAIVRSLNILELSLSELIASLQNELNERKKQKEYFDSSFFSFIRMED